MYYQFKKRKNLDRKKGRAGQCDFPRTWYPHSGYAGQMVVQRALHQRGGWAQHPSRKACLLSPQVRIKEETRLVSIIDQIDKAVAIIPRGALFKTPFGPIHVNRTFEGTFSGASLMGRRASPPKHSQTHIWESGPTCLLPQQRSSRNHISWGDVCHDLASVFGTGYPVPGP